MKEKLKKLFAYYTPYKFLFYSDMFFAVIGAVITLIIPLVIRYITNDVVYFEAEYARRTVLILGISLYIVTILSLLIYLIDT